MKVGVIGLGKMGNGVAFRLAQAGHEVWGFDPDAHARKEAEADGIQVVDSLEKLPEHVSIFWLMVPAGKVVDLVIDQLRPHLKKGDIIVDGGNSHFPDSVRRSKELEPLDVSFMDVGTSGGLLGRDIGFSLMIGGDKKIYEKLEPLFKALAAPSGYSYMGPAGAGHYVKMVHNGIEYALLQSYAEGLHLLYDNKRYPNLNMAAIAQVWSNGSVIRSWITDLLATIYTDQNQDLSNISGKIGGGSTGRWTVQEAREQKIPVRLIDDALQIRDESQKTGGDYATKLVALLRNQFGGHSFKTTESDDENN